MFAGAPVKRKRVISSPKTWIFMGIGVGINVLLTFLCTYFNLPIYLDVICTVFISCFYGVLPGLVVAIASSLLGMIFNFANIYYAVLAGAIAILADVFMRKSLFRKWWGYVIALFLFAFIGGGIGTIIYYLLNDHVIKTADALTNAFSNMGLPIFWAFLTSSFIWDLLDKGIVLLVLLIVMLTYPQSEKALNYFPQAKYAARPWSKKISSKRFFDDKYSVRYRLSIILTSIFAVIAFSVAFFTANSSYNSTVSQYEVGAKAVSSLATHAFDKSDIETWITTKDESDPAYVESKIHLNRLITNDARINNLFVFTLDSNNQLITLFDLKKEGMPVSKLGENLVLNPVFNNELSNIIQGNTIDHSFRFNDGYNNVTSWLSSVTDATNDNVVCYAGVTMEIDSAAVAMHKNVTKILSIEIAIFMIGSAASIYWVNSRIIGPIQELDDELGDFNHVGPAHWLTSRERYNRNINKSKNELGELARMIRSAEDQVSNGFFVIKKQSGEILSMQRNTVYALADIVGTRDECTGNHIKRTSSFVELLITRLKEERKFKEVITKRYINDISVASMLHDVGKLKISDQILNKQGRLTEEEFETIKTHTTEGEKIIAIALKGSGTSTYLNIAREIAGGHHERWDGRGYPRGLKGEEIPLSARVMAVVDVFDALVSERPYKEAYPFEKAIRIIKEESGTHFDPDVVEAFFSIQDKIKDNMEKQAE